MVYNKNMQDSEVEQAKQRMEERLAEKEREKRRRHKPQYGFDYYMPDKHN